MTYWDSLLLNLERQGDFHRQLIELLQHENQLLISNNTNDLTNVISHQDYLTNEIARLQDEKNHIMRQILMSDEDVSITQLLQIAPGDIARKLKDLQQKLTTYASDLIGVSHINTRLIDVNLRYVSHMMKAVSEESANSAPVYSARGTMMEKAQDTILSFVG
jgi:hypothetical protein